MKARVLVKKDRIAQMFQKAGWVYLIEENEGLPQGAGAIYEWRGSGRPDYPFEAEGHYIKITPDD